MRTWHWYCNWWASNPWYSIGWRLPTSFRLKTWQHQTLCYCGTGMLTELYVEVFGIGLCVRRWIDWTRHPCVCDRVIAELELNQ